MPKRIDGKSADLLASEWDALATTRFKQIESGADITYRHILVPCILNLISDQSASTILDAGCGVGFLTNLLTEHTDRVIGIDPSQKSIQIASEHYGEKAHFISKTMEDYSVHNASSVDIVIANMVIMDVLKLNKFLDAAYRVLRPGGCLVFSTTHPCFWSTYYGYSDETWYRYDEEIIVESDFKITAQPNCPLPSTHIHRPLSRYIQEFNSTFFSIENLLEPMPTDEVNTLYPEPWSYPRYLAGRLRRN